MKKEQVYCKHKHIYLHVIGHTAYNSYWAQCKECHYLWEWPNEKMDGWHVVTTRDDLSDWFIVFNGKIVF